MAAWSQPEWRNYLQSVTGLRGALQTQAIRFLSLFFFSRARLSCMHAHQRARVFTRAVVTVYCGLGRTDELRERQKSNDQKCASNLERKSRARMSFFRASAFGEGKEDQAALPRKESYFTVLDCVIRAKSRRHPTVAFFKRLQSFALIF